MTVPREVSDIERLIEDGLSKYGQGDLDGALLDWEQALAIDPENPQANSYVDYVRMNYELLTAEVNRDADAAPFGIADDEGEYSIEIFDGLAASGEHSAPLFMDPLDEGWMFEEEQVRFVEGSPLLAAAAAAAEAPDEPASAPEPMTLELDADEPPVLEMEADEPPEPAPAPPVAIDVPDGGVSFEDATREYTAPADSGRNEFESPEATPGFGTPADTQTPHQFAQQTTALRQRSLGFVKATGVVETVSPLAAPYAHSGSVTQPIDPARRQKRPSAVPPELQMTLRTPGEEPDAALELAPLPAAAPPPAAEDDLLSSLPTPRPAPSVPHLVTPEPPATSSVPTYRELSLESLQQALRASDPAPTPSKTQTLDFEVSTKKITPLRDMPTARIPVLQRQAVSDTAPTNPGPARDPFLSAPTRDLGLRPPRASTEDEPTGQMDIRTLRADAAASRTDAAPPVDPIDARTAQILVDLDDGAPADESPSDRTRRRITRLFERATAWSRDGELDKAVAAVDLALSEDPNSAIAQKLIQRHRDTVQTVFQGYLGDLDRQPMLARPLQELAKEPINPRAAFLLSRVDGSITLDEILDVCGMPRLEAFRYLCQLYLRGILR